MSYGLPMQLCLAVVELLAVPGSFVPERLLSNTMRALGSSQRKACQTLIEDVKRSDSPWAEGPAGGKGRVGSSATFQTDQAARSRRDGGRLHVPDERGGAVARLARWIRPKVDSPHAREGSGRGPGSS